MIKVRRFSPGFSLIEVIVSILLLSFTLMFTFQLFTAGLRTFKESVKKTMVIKLTKSKFEEAFAQQRSNTNWTFPTTFLLSGNFSSLDPGAAAGPAQKTLRYTDFTYNITIDPNPPLPGGMPNNAGIKKVTVTVTGPVNNNPKTTTMTAYLGAVPMPEENRSIGSVGSKWYEVPYEGYFPNPDYFKPLPPQNTINEQVIWLSWSGSQHLKKTVALKAPVINSMKSQTKIIFSAWLF